MSKLKKKKMRAIHVEAMRSCVCDPASPANARCTVGGWIRCTGTANASSRITEVAENERLLALHCLPSGFAVGDDATVELAVENTRLAALVDEIEDENARLLAIINRTDSDLLAKWLAEEGSEAHAVHLAGVEHEIELRRLYKVLELIVAESENDKCNEMDSLIICVNLAEDALAVRILEQDSKS